MEIFVTKIFFRYEKKLLLQYMIVQNLYWMQEGGILIFF